MSHSDRRPNDIAIIGMSCLYPKAPNLRAFWENILAGVDAIGEPPKGSWTHRVVDAKATTENDRLYTARGGYIGDLARFDPLAYGVMPKAVDGAEPEQFIALALAKQALVDAGYDTRPFDRRRAGLILGRGTYVNRGVISCFQHTLVIDQVLDLLRRLHPEDPAEALDALRLHLKEGLPPFNPENSPGLAHSVLVGRIANRLDLMGPAFTVDAACASSLIAVDYGIRDLLNGACDLVLAGGIQVSTTHPILLLFTQLGALARSGRVRPFHKDGDGTLLGEGAGIVVLKRRADALRDGDRIYAVLRGLGTSSDGKAMGVLAPRVEGEELALRRAYETTGVDPQSIGLIEAHGTGTPVGDAVEIDALRRVFGDGGPALPLGSVKSMIGHPIPAAAAAGLIKASLAVYHKILPPTLHADAPHPGLAGSRLELNAAARPWIHRGPGPRRAGVSAFGFGGINAHAIVEEAEAAGSRPLTMALGAPAAAPGSADIAAAASTAMSVPPAMNVHATRDSELYLVRAADRASLQARTAALALFVGRNPSVAPHDLAFTLAVPESTGLCLAIVATSLDELRRKAEWAAGRLADPACRRIKEIGGIYFFEEPLARQGGLAFLFPGEGAQYRGMLSDLCRHFPEARAWFDVMDRAFADHPRGFVPSRFLFPASDNTALSGGAMPGTDALFEMETAIETVFAADQAMHAILTGLGLRPDAVVGHSTGEYSALLASGAVEVEDEGRLIDYILAGNRATERAAKAGKVPRGVLLAVGPVSTDTLAELTARGDLALAMDNCPHQAVVCGDDDAVARAETALKARGAICQRLPFERAYHTERFLPVVDELRGYYDSGRFAAPRVRLYSCAAAAVVPADPEQVRRLALMQWAMPVRFRETVEAMHADGVRLFVEVGPRGNLTAFVQDTLKGKPHLAIAANIPSRSGILQLHHLLGLLAAHGVPLALAPLHTRRGARRLSMDAITEGAALPPLVDRSQPLPMNLPALHVDDAFLVKWESATRPAAAPSSPPAMADTLAPFSIPAFPISATAPASAAAAADPRAAVMQAYMKTMEEFLRTQEALLQGALAARGGNGHATGGGGRQGDDGHGAPSAGGGPRIAASQSGVTRRTLSIDDDLYLRHHTIGGRVSEEDPSLTALPIVPLAFSLEMMAEAATALAPRLRPVGFRDVRVHRWIALETGSVTLEIETRPPVGDAIDVTVRVVPRPTPGSGPNASPPAVAVEGRVLLADRFPEPAPPTPFAPRDARPCRWSGEALYDERQTHGMFHGPTLRGVVSVEAVGSDGALGTLKALPAQDLFRDRRATPFHTDPMLLDAASQILGYWTAERLERAFVVFPFAVEAIDLHGPALTPPARARARVRSTAEGTDRLRADLEVLDAAGRPHLTARGWQVKRIDLPPDLYAFRQSPRDVILSDPTAPPARLDGQVACSRLSLPLDFMEADGGVWWETLAHFTLGRAERAVWHALTGARRRREWLMGRIAAKDAVRLHLLATRGLRVFPADIEIVADRFGRPEPSGALLAKLGAALSVSIAHTDGIAMALAAEPPRGLGIDIERLDRRRGDYERAAFNEEERALLGADADATRPERALRLWCAKEAVAKAIGRGLMGSPLNLERRGGDAGFERVDLGVTGSLARELPHLVDHPVAAFVARHANLIVAMALGDPPK
jgi:acyl transferase domain-containing protein/phosphopantetheinyl transferase